VLYAGAPTGDNADLPGTLTIEGNCLYVDWEDPNDQDDVRDSRMLPAFPANFTRWDEETQTIELDGTALRAGTEVVLGGGGLGSDPDDRDWVVPPDPDCDASEIFMVGRP
jgi:hypothetical protein